MLKKLCLCSNNNQAIFLESVFVCHVADSCVRRLMALSCMVKIAVAS